MLWRMSRLSLTSCTARHFLSLLKTLHVWMLRAEEKPSQQYGWHFIAGWLLQYPSHSVRLRVSRCWRERLLLCEFGELPERGTMLSQAAESCKP